MLRYYSLLPFLLFQVLLFGQDTLTINIDFGGTPTELPWNNQGNSDNGSLSNLLEMNGTSTEIGIEVYDAFNGTNMTGTQMADPALDIPASASGDSFYGNAFEFAGGTEPTAGVLITGLDPSKLYNISIFASRIATDSRETQYNIFSGQADTTMYLEVANNESEVASLQQWQPNNDGTIRIEATTGPNNTNEFGFYYMGAIRIQYDGIVIPVDPALELTFPNGGEYWQPNKTPEIRWRSQGIGMVTIEYSIDNGANWETIATTSSLSQSFPWTIPNSPSEACLVRISGANLSSQSNANFEIADEEIEDCHIVVLGSSTAAGAGPTSVDSAWVWKYRDHIFQRDTRFRVSNLARGGFTTYNLLPTGTTIPMNINQSIDTARNISKALSLAPNAIIINLPSNDAAHSYPVSDQLMNYDLILAQVVEDSIPLWICTPQPRNGFSATQMGIQNDLRDSTFERYGNFAIDFWNGFVDNAGFLNPLYDSGDGVHLNNAGHQLLFERVLGAQVDSFLLAKKYDPVITGLNEIIQPLNIYPNPTADFILINELEPPFDIEIYNSNGILLNRLHQYQNRQIKLNHPGLQYLLIRKGERNYGAWLMKY